MHRWFGITAGHLLVLAILVNCDMLLADPSNSRRVGRRLISPFEVHFYNYHFVTNLYQLYQYAIQISNISDDINLN